MSLFSSFSKTFSRSSSKLAPKLTPRKPVFKPVKVQPAPQATQAILNEAKNQAREIIIEAKSQALKIREASEAKNRRLIQTEAIARQNLETAKQQQQQAVVKLEQAKKIKKIHQEKLEKVASLTKQEAKIELLKSLDKELAETVAKKIKAANEKAENEAEAKAQDILVTAMKHGATDYVAEYTVSTVKLPDENIKGRIIGKEGRNIRSFEQVTGVDMDLDESPGEVRLSSFDSVRREIARVALTRLIADGRIQPSRIEEYVQKATNEIKRVMLEEGKNLAHAVAVYNLPRELLEILGRFKYRFSYGQNMIAHTLEETKIGISLAQEVGVNVDTVRLGCLLHDIGKVVSDQEGSHVEVGVNLLKKFNLPQVVIDCVAQHHEDAPFTSNEAVLVYIADAISGARPGARYEDYDEYVKRLKQLEEIAHTFAGVKDAFAIQAGREVRVIVNPEQISDAQAVKLAHHLKTKIQKEMTYPGTVKINVIREVRASETAI